MTPRLSPRDRQEVRSRGLKPADLVPLFRLLCRPPRPLNVLRPCSAGDGIERLSRAARLRLARRGEQVFRAGRVSFFVPSSGAASRLLEPLTRLDRARRESGRSARALLADKGTRFEDARLFFSALPSLALSRPLAGVLRRLGLRLSPLLRKREFDVVLDALLGDQGLRLERSPKGLLPFHRRGRGVHTPVEEHLAEAAGWASDKRKPLAVHFTVSPNHLAAFRSLARSAAPALCRRIGVRLDVRFSVQSPSTETPALDARGRWVRRSDGRILFRPGGHGALLGNLEKTRGDIVLIRNIDNVPVPAFHREGMFWRQVLIGRLAELQQLSACLLAGLQGSDPSQKALLEAEGFLGRVLGPRPVKGLSQRERTDAAVSLLKRPWRVCGMVRHTGEPGGGPFWVEGKEGPSKQIVEAVQIQGAKRRLLKRSTHFNPVDMAVGLRDSRGRAFELSRFAESSGVLVGRKPGAGGEIRTLEYPGLWNGGMAGWNTVFVEIPIRLFHPVKTVTDLLRPGHGGKKRA